MPNEEASFQSLSVAKTSEGATRRVGFELEFSGLDLEQASQAVLSALGGEIDRKSVAEHEISVPELGTFGIEIDWAFLKRNADAAGKGEREWVEPLSQLAPLLVPIEVVAPPIAADRLDCLSPMIAALREAGAQGTEESLIAAYGVHINTEIPDLTAQTLHRYLKAFALLQWWLMDAHAVDPARRLSPYIDPWPEAYLHEVLTLDDPDHANLIDSYLAHNATRNRALDMLPLLAHIDESSVRAVVDDDRINARPAFHYRLPNCQIEKPDWNLASSWNLWCVVEALANNAVGLNTLAGEFVDSDRLIIGVSRSEWVKRMNSWLVDHALA